MDVYKGIISVLIHSMNRCYDLKKSVPYIIKAANQSPPVEIFILNYSSTDDIDEYMNGVIKSNGVYEYVKINEFQTEIVPSILNKPNFFTYKKVDGKKFYNSPNARNTAQLLSKGEYGIQWACDSYCKPEFIKVVREIISKDHPVWLYEPSSFQDGISTGRAIICKKDEFIASGGYDERFKYYAPEDRDLCMRLRRREGKLRTFPSSLVWDTKTSWKEKLKNVFKDGSHRAQLNKMHEIYEENCGKGVLVANE
jgi:hypothetical protein